MSRCYADAARPGARIKAREQQIDREKRSKRESSPADATIPRMGMMLLGRIARLSISAENPCREAVGTAAALRRIAHIRCALLGISHLKRAAQPPSFLGLEPHREPSMRGY
jgi:hypothetical protein